MQLRVWQDARELYIRIWSVFKKFPYELNHISSQQIASVDSIHRNITEEQFEKMDALAYKLESGLKKLIESIQSKQANNDWDDSFIIKESNKLYTTTAD